jgi:uncharacterized protein YlxW (UPF0749 family)
MKKLILIGMSLLAMACASQDATIVQTNETNVDILNQTVLSLQVQVTELNYEIENLNSEVKNCKNKKDKND